MKQNLTLITAASMFALMAVGCSSSSTTMAPVDMQSTTSSAGDTDTATADVENTTAGGVDAGTTDTATGDANTGDAGATDMDATTDGGSTTDVDLNGDYTVVASLNEASLAVPECEAAEGVLSVTGTNITGTVTGGLNVTGTINPDLTITGGFAFSGGAKFADYYGLVDGEALWGEWFDIRGCRGPWRAEKR